MRLTSDMFVSALLRRVNASGGFGAVIRKGNREAGAIFILSRDRFGETSLLGPAMQLTYTETKPAERQFSEVLRSSDAAEIAAKIDREAQFDSDVWAIEIEPGSTALNELITIVD